MNVVAITQARFSSSRLPGKVLLELGSATVLDLHLKRVKKSKLINKFIVATTNEAESTEIEKIANRHEFDCFHGDLNDVLDRFYRACASSKPDYVVRITSDCPLIDPTLIDDLISKFLEAKVDYAANSLVPTLPDGMDAEIFSFSALETAWKEATKKSEREHVTPYIRDCGKYKTLSVQYPLDYGKYRLTLDTPEDYEVLKKLVDVCGEDANLEEYVSYLSRHEEILKLNSNYERNEGLKKSLKEDLYVKPNNKL